MVKVVREKGERLSMIRNIRRDSNDMIKMSEKKNCFLKMKAKKVWMKSKNSLISM